MTKVFIDGSAGTTGLRIYERLGQRPDLELIILTDEKRNPQTHKIVSIRAFFGENEDFENLLEGFNGVKYTDITGTNLLDH